MNIGYEAKRIFHNKTGLGNYSRDIIRILSHHYSNNSYFLYNPKTSDQILFEANNSNVFEKLPSTKFTKKFKNYWRQKGIVDDLKRDNITLFHGLSGELPVGLKKKHIKSIVTIHDLIFMRYPKLYSFFDRKVYYFKFKKAAQAADKIIAISQQTKDDIITYLKVEPSKVEVIYQGCHSVFKDSYTNLEKKEVIKRYNLPAKFILNVGTIEERKNALTIVKSIKDIDTTLVLIGKETSYSKKIRDYIEDHNLKNKVLFLKGLTSKELAITYQLATLFIYPSIFEGFGIPIIEALYSKVPVITTKFGVFPEAGGPNSLYIDPNDSNELKEKIKLLLENESLRTDMIEKGFTFVQKFNDDVIAKNWFLTYSNILR
ncbi:glycosyl transferase family 1 [Flavobacterium sp. ALD4]|uniref:glycosyltransferase family 4 protein n=1 Tax=Flavobacterium sp. ALD4 TaxID=2058314 RepID=UPI000C31BFB7|nr:glycosyltransferase family 1 protein [Flavobacterium sp. ALD4]PKH68805.1 glycosyl transferase family 1 [Flavobacterium sp. ALD4]